MAPTYCCVPGCFVNSKDDTITSFFSFPLDEERCYQWARNCGRHDLLEKSPAQLRKSHRVCAMHFIDEMFSGITMSRLKPNAVPTVFSSCGSSSSVSTEMSAPKTVTSKVSKEVSSKVLSTGLTEGLPSSAPEPSTEPSTSTTGLSSIQAECLPNLPHDMPSTSGTKVQGNLRLLTLEPGQLRSRVLCCKHFKDSDFTNSLKNRLTKFAVPEPFVEHLSEVSSPESTHAIPPKKTYRSNFNPLDYSPERPEQSTRPRRPTGSPAVSKFLPNMPDEPERYKKTKHSSRRNSYENKIFIKTLQTQIKNQQQKIRHQQTAMSKLRKKINILERTVKNKYVSKTSTKMQIERRRDQWEEDKKNISLLLYYKAPGAYYYLRNKFGIILPSVTTIKNWIGHLDCLPFLNYGGR